MTYDEPNLRARDYVSHKIDHLFRSVLRSDGREFTYEDVERGTDGRVSRSYVWKLRHGRNSNPSLDVIEALAVFFSVPPEYFFGDSIDDDGDAQEAAEIAALLHDPAAHAVAERAKGLGPAALSTVVNLIENLKTMESAHARASSLAGEPSPEAA